MQSFKSKFENQFFGIPEGTTQGRREEVGAGGGVLSKNGERLKIFFADLTFVKIFSENYRGFPKNQN